MANDTRRSRQYPLGWPTTSFATLTTQNVLTQTQVLFRGRRLIIASDIAASFLINDFRIGKNSQFPSSGPVPARVFSEAAVGVDLALDTAQISQALVLNATNTSGSTVLFNAALLGDAMD